MGDPLVSICPSALPRSADATRVRGPDAVAAGSTARSFSKTGLSPTSKLAGLRFVVVDGHRWCQNRFMAPKQPAELETLSEDRCWQLLAQKSVGRLAVWIDTGPDIFPVAYRIEDETLVLRTAPGLKLAAATVGPGVAFEVDALDELHHTGWSVVVRGTAVEVEEPEELLEVSRLLVEPWTGGDKSHYLRIIPKTVSGRQIPGRPGSRPTHVPSQD